MRRRLILFLPLTAAVVPWIATATVNISSIYLFATASLLALAVATSLLLDEREWAKNFCVFAVLAAFSFVIAVAMGEPNPGAGIWLAAVTLLANGALNAVCYVMIVRSDAAEDAAWRRRKLASETKQIGQGLTAADAIKAHQKRWADPWGIESSEPD